MRIRKRMNWSMVCALVLCLMLLLSLSASADELRASPLSPALEVLAGQTDLSLWHLVGEAQDFSEDSFLRGLNLSRMKTIRILEVPDPAQGVLRLDASTLETGALLDASDLSRLSFEAASGSVKKASFQFEVNECGVAYSCHLYALNAPNASPTLDGIPVLYQKPTTHKNLPLSGKFYAVDPEGDEMIFEVAVPPKYGSIVVSGDSYTYLPFPDYVGVDAFSYVARDRFGNYSAAMQISLSVSAVSSDLAFADLDDPATRNAVLTLASAGILGGTRVGNEVYFYPEKAMTRAEFLVLAMSASGIKDLPECVDTGFADDKEIPDAMKPYVAAAYRLGYFDGQVKNGEVCFLPTAEMTKGEAARLSKKILLLDTPKSVAAVSGQIGDETIQSVFALSQVGLIQNDEAYRTDEILTRKDAAKLLAGIFSLCR